MPGRPHMKPLVRLALLSIALACAASRAGDEAPAALYSFADLYRLTVSAPPSAGLGFAEPQIRLAAREPGLAAAPRGARAGLRRARRAHARRADTRGSARLLCREPGALRRAAHLPHARARGVGEPRDDRRAARSSVARRGPRRRGGLAQ